jgi:hypothetical protein
MKYIVYELIDKKLQIKDIVKAINSELARKKAIIGTDTKYANTIALTHDSIK